MTISPPRILFYEVTDVRTVFSDDYNIDMDKYDAVVLYDDVECKIVKHNWIPELVGDHRPIDWINTMHLHRDGVMGTIYTYPA